MRSYAGSRARCRRKGTAFIEALIVCVVTLGFLSATWFFHQLMGQKALALRTARYQAWTATRFDCSQASITGQDSRSVATPLHTPAGTSATLSVEARVVMTCNIEPRPGDTVVDAVLSMIDLGSLVR